MFKVNIDFHFHRWRNASFLFSQRTPTFFILLQRAPTFFLFRKGLQLSFFPQRTPTFFFSAKKKVAKKKLSAAFLTGQPSAAFPVRNARRKSFLENRSVAASIYRCARCCATSKSFHFITQLIVSNLCFTISNVSNICILFVYMRYYLQFCAL